MCRVRECRTGAKSPRAVMQVVCRPLAYAPKVQRAAGPVRFTGKCANARYRAADAIVAARPSPNVANQTRVAKTTGGANKSAGFSDAYKLAWDLPTRSPADPGSEGKR